MKTKKVIEVLQAFNGGDITEKEAFDQLQNCEPFNLYSAVLEMYRDGFDLEKGDLPKISKIYVKLYEEESVQLIKKLDKGHPIKRLTSDHKKIVALLDMLDSIAESVNQDIKDQSDINEGVEYKDKIKKIEMISVALKQFEEHLLKEEELIFPVWSQKGRIGDTILLEDEHEGIKEDVKVLVEEILKSEKDWTNKSWNDLSEKIDKVTGKIRFHTFHEEDMFYPIVVNDLDEQDFKEIKKKMDEFESRQEGPTLTDYEKYLSREK
ncbi:MAG: hemerythrin domain-containing protein [Candidatus Thermoplasmatota archaeon]